MSDESMTNAENKYTDLIKQIDSGLPRACQMPARLLLVVLLAGLQDAEVSVPDESLALAFRFGTYLLRCPRFHRQAERLQTLTYFSVLTEYARIQLLSSLSSMNG